MLFQEYHSQLQDTLKLFLRFIKEEKGILLNSFYIRDFKRELVIEFLEWYRTVELAYRLQTKGWLH